MTKSIIEMVESIVLFVVKNWVVDHEVPLPPAE